MNIEYLISMTEKRLAMLEQAKRNSEQAGDIQSVLDMEAQILEVGETLRKLRAAAAL